MSFYFKEEQYLTINEIKQVLPIHPKTLSRMLKNGEIQGAAKIGKQWYLPERKLQFFLQERFKLAN